MCTSNRARIWSDRFGLPADGLKAVSLYTAGKVDGRERGREREKEIEREEKSCAMRNGSSALQILYARD